ncbi:uncharacterized protein PRCAT00005809001 [Priceomyces carsonii]|uniref:uncharacterized protein n=1 Tax=Priceomyces carsonii TaxID=28549 RepID=UPI002EDB76E5|nr:unnamed protein product [Priceomyces carsonii]
MKLLNSIIFLSGFLLKSGLADQGPEVARIIFYDGDNCLGDQAGTIWTMYEKGDHLCTYKGKTNSVYLEFTGTLDYEVGLQLSEDRKCDDVIVDVATNISESGCFNLTTGGSLDPQGIFGYQIPPESLAAAAYKNAKKQGKIDFVTVLYA